MLQCEGCILEEEELAGMFSVCFFQTLVFIFNKTARQQQLAYVEDARRREQPPLDAIAAPEILRGELCRA